MEFAITNIIDFRAMAEKVFGQGGFVETLERRGLYRSRLASVVDTEWDATSANLLAYHWTIDADPIIETFYFPPTWANKESWKNIFNTDYPDCPEDALDIALWAARTPSKIVLEDENGIRTVRSIDTDVVVKKEKRITPVKPKLKRKIVDESPTFFGGK